VREEGARLRKGQAADFTVLASPDKISFPSAAGLLVLLEATDRDPVGVGFPTRSALDFEGVVERRLLAVLWLEIGHSVEFSSDCECQHRLLIATGVELLRKK